MRDIRDDLKERLASISDELDVLKKRESLLASIQQSVFGLLEEEDRRFRDRASLHVAAFEPTPIAGPEATPIAAPDFRPASFNGAELPNGARVSQRSWAELRTAER